MQESSKGNLSICLSYCKLVNDVAVSVSFKTKANSCTLGRLKGSCSCDCFPSGSEEACVCFALYHAVRNSLCGDPLAISRSRVSDVHCGSAGGSFTISWRTKGNASSVRKSIGMVLKQLSPAKMFPHYSNLVRNLSGKTNRGCFNYVTDEMVKALKSKIHIVVVGNIKLEKKDSKGKKVNAVDLPAMLDVLSKKLNIVAPDSGKETPSGHIECRHSEQTEIKCSGYDAFILKEYISAKVKCTPPMVCDGSLVVNMTPSKWDTASSKLKGSVKDYTTQKYTKVGSELSNVLAYMAGSVACLSSFDLQKLLNDKLKPVDVDKLLNSHL